MSTERRRLSLGLVLAVGLGAAAAGAVVTWRVASRAAPPVPGCQSDDDCAAAFVCRPGRLGDGRMGRVCRIRGTGREGEPCRSPAKDLQEGCLEALHCNYGSCGRPCEPGDPGSCPAGMRCRDSGEGPSCVTNCTPASCAAPSQCVAIDEGFSTCAVPIGDRCDLRACGPGQRCRARYLQRQVALVETRCITACRGVGECPTPQFCDEGECATPCRLDGNECPGGTFCAAALSRNAARCWPE